jgi:FlaA1/EpsC-like NDP-sugar epimerase
MERTIFEFTDAEILEVLGRKERALPIEKLKRMYLGKKVLVTGGAGSIGSELVDTLNQLGAVVFLIDKDEHGVFRMRNKYPDVGCILGDVLFDMHNLPVVDIIIHASAYKHAPMSEDYKKVYYRNNVEGFECVMEFAYKYNLKVILVSSDKAINPTSAMGWSKKYCEEKNTSGHSVRFGNVLQSQGSVVPIFLEQLSRGENLTITDPKIKRYFMSKKEAVGLILESLEIGGRGDIFALDMGEQIKIVDLASALMKLTGVTVDIDFVGLRPTEKLEEQLYYKDCSKTLIDGIFKCEDSNNWK